MSCIDKKPWDGGYFSKWCNGKRGSKDLKDGGIQTKGAIVLENLNEQMLQESCYWHYVKSYG